MTFEESMDRCNTQRNPSANWKVMEKAYNDYYLNYQGDRTPKIPKIIHQIWLGSPFPDKYKILTDRWQEMHPDWTLILWDDDKIKNFGLTNQWMYDNTYNPASKSDVARYEILYSYGGVYVDTDFYCCKNLNDLLYLDFFGYAAGSYDKSAIPASLPQSLFGCSQGNELLANVIRHIAQQSNVPHSIADIIQITGPDMFTREILKELDKHPMSVVFPPNYFTPFPGQFRENIRNLNFIDIPRCVSHYAYPETYAIHLHYCSWQNPDLLK